MHIHHTYIKRQTLHTQTDIDTYTYINRQKLHTQIDRYTDTHTHINRHTLHIHIYTHDYIAPTCNSVLCFCNIVFYIPLIWNCTSNTSPSNFLEEFLATTVRACVRAFAFVCVTET